jgi:hypothetical protein
MLDKSNGRNENSIGQEALVTKYILKSAEINPQRTDKTIRILYQVVSSVLALDGLSHLDSDFAELCLAEVVFRSNRVGTTSILLHIKYLRKSSRETGGVFLGKKNESN